MAHRPPSPSEIRPVRFRLLIDGARDGASNMAVDESILDACVTGETVVPTLRLYAWSPPALSLGRAQPAAGTADREFLAREGIDLVRRPTGGTAVLHEHERTYSVVARLRTAPFPGGVVDTYRKIALALTEALRELGVPAREVPSAAPRRGGKPASAICFAERSQQEITAGEDKIVGSAQLRRRGAFLQHGSIVLRADARRTARATGLPPPPGFRVAGVENFVPGTLSGMALDAAIVAAFARAFAAEMVPGTLSRHEAERAEALCEGKYRRSAWTLAGRG